MNEQNSDAQCPECKRKMGQTYKACLVSMKKSFDTRTKESDTRLNIAILLTCVYCETSYHHDIEVLLPISS